VRIILALSFSLLAAVSFGQDKPPLVTRDRVELNLAGAEAVITAAKLKAAEMKLKVNIAVVDDGGHLLAFARLDGAIGVGGATGEQDAEIARAGIEALLKELK
jgi:glc operon protein GlcG